MADQDKNKNYFLHIDELSRRLSADQRHLSEENHFCLVTEELLGENEKEYTQMQSELHYVQKSIEEYRKREQNFKHIKSLQSTLEMLEENTAIQDAEIALLEKELEALNLEKDSLAKTYYSKLEEAKQRLEPHLVDDNVAEKSLKRDHVMQQKEELKSQVAIVKKNYSNAVLEDWQKFKAFTLELAAKAIKLQEEKKKMDICKQKSQDLDIDIKKFKEEMSVVQIAKQKQFEQRQQEFQQSQEQERLQQQQLWLKNQGYCESQQQQNWQSPQSCNISSVSPRSCISMSPIQRQDTPRPKPYSSLSFSLPKLQVPKFGGKKISRSLELPKRFEDGKFTDMGSGIRHCNSSVEFGAGAFSISRTSLTSHGSYGPPSYMSSSNVTAEAAKLMHSSLGGPSELLSQSHSAALSVKATGSSSGLASLEEKIGTHSINVSGHSLASDALNRLKSNNTGVSNGEVRSISPYFEKAKRSLPLVASQESHEYSADHQKKRLCQSVPSVSWSGDSSPISKENAELQRSSPPVKSRLSFQNKESWKVYMSSLLQSPEIVYTKAPASLKAHQYEATGPETTRAKAGTTPAEASVQPCTPHRLHIEELTESGEPMENLIPHEEAQGSTKISVSDSKGQPTEVNQDSIGQLETSLASSQGFIVSSESSNSSQEPPNDSTVSIVSPAQTTTITSSMVREVQCNLNAPIQVEKLTNFPMYSESPSLAGPSTSASCTSGSSSIPAPISQSLISQQLACKGPDLCSTPKPDNSSKQRENKSLASGDSLVLKMPSTVYSGYSTVDSAFSPLFSNEPDNIFGGKSLGFLDVPGQSQESESDKGTSGIGFSLFGDSTSQQEENSNFFSFDFGGSSTHTEDRGSTSRGVFSLFGSDSADNSEDSGSGANFRLF